jgi:hypothetical protein
MQDPRYDPTLVSRTGAGRQGNIFSFRSREKNVLDFSSYRSGFFNSHSGAYHISDMKTAVIAVVVAAFGSFGAYGQQPKTVAIGHVPFVGCQSDGQAGHLSAPRGESKVVQLSGQATNQLAYYKAAQGIGVLAPRGWYCFATYGSSGAILYVSEQPINTSDLFSSKWPGFSGAVVQLTQEDGDTSGRFGVAKIVARVFPAYRAFVTKVVGEDIEPAGSLSFEPYPEDKLAYKSKKLVEYETPPQTEGLGTQSRLQPNTRSIRGAAILVGQVPDLLLLAIRLRDSQSSLTAAIVRQCERDSTTKQR